MKKIFFLAALFVAFITACTKDEDKSPFTEVSISMGGDYVYDIFYSFENGEIQVPRATWDIAFSIPVQSAAIRINEGSGVQVFTVGGVDEWNNLSIDPLEPTLNKLWNDKSNWLNGAFNRNSDTENPFNYGWGTYDAAITHSVWPDSVYALRLTNGNYKKFMIIKKDGPTNTNHFKWADLDGSNEDSASIDMNLYASKQFVYYSIADKEVVEYEPDSDSWDILFTAYKERIPMGSGVFMDYDVTGVLVNQNCQVAKVSGTKPENASVSDSEVGFSSEANVIGWDWKVYDNVSNKYTLTDSLSYFVKTASAKEYQIFFSKFEGSSTGNLSFKFK